MKASSTGGKPCRCVIFAQSTGHKALHIRSELCQGSRLVTRNGGRVLVLVAATWYVALALRVDVRCSRCATRRYRSSCIESTGTCHAMRRHNVFVKGTTTVSAPADALVGDGSAKQVVLGVKSYRQHIVHRVKKKKKTTTKTESIAWHTDHASPRRRKRKKNESVDANEFKPSLAMRTSRETVRQHKHDARTQIVDVKPRYLAYSIGTIQCLSYNRVHDHNRFWFVATIEKVGSAVRTTGMSPGMTPRGAAKHHMQQAALSPVATARLLGDQKHTQFVCVDRKEHLPRQNTKENI